jgi:hypothetical protein
MKTFGTEAQLSSHMNQPTARCHQFLNELITVSDILEGAKPRQPFQNLDPFHQSGNTSLSADQDEAMVWEPNLPEDISSFDCGNDSSADVNKATSSQKPNSSNTPAAPHIPGHRNLHHLPSHPHACVEEHPNAPWTWEGGSTFLQGFNNDRYSKQRRSNLYYPFASRGEWDLASFLLLSPLSMVAIDQFLKLQLVRHCCWYINLFLMARHRFKT